MTRVKTFEVPYIFRNSFVLKLHYVNRRDQNLRDQEEVVEETEKHPNRRISKKEGVGVFVSERFRAGDRETAKVGVRETFVGKYES